MESLGKRLTDARTNRGLDFDQVSRETNIARRYLEALEREDYSVFPGEPYLLGFLRNYCEYLGLNAGECVSAYKNYKIQETPVPLKDLMPKRPFTDNLPFRNGIPPQLLLGLLAMVLLVVIGYGGFRLVSMILANRPEQVAVTPVERDPQRYAVSSGEFSQRVYIGDILVIGTAGTDHELTVMDTAPAVRLETPVGLQLIELGQDLFLDLTGDGQPDVKIFIADLFKNDPSKGADIRLSTEAGELGAVLPARTEAVPAVPAASIPVVAATGQTRHTVLFEGASAYPVTMNATFRGYCLFRYEADRNPREERYYQKSELLTVQAQNGIRIWASNGNAVKLQVVGGGRTMDIELSRPGEVIVRDLKWIRDEDTGRFRFVVMDID